VTQNFVGRTGALVAGHLLWLMGLAGYLLPFSMTWFGVSKLHSKMKITRVAWLGVVVMIVTAAGLLEVQNLLNERDHITPLGGGGALGYFVGGSILKTLFGKIGATLLLTVVYVVGLFLTTGQHPLTAIRSIRAELSRWQQEREAQRLIEEKLAEEAANTIPGTLTPVPTELRRKKKGAELRGDTPVATTMELPLKFDPPHRRSSTPRSPLARRQRGQAEAGRSVGEKARAEDGAGPPRLPGQSHGALQGLQTAADGPAASGRRTATMLQPTKASCSAFRPRLSKRSPASASAWNRATSPVVRPSPATRCVPSMACA
jgi:S-DNA-T family DNA segregation ATPase FtsK/SpoIIIE